MNKFQIILIILQFGSILASCHRSCICYEKSNKCKECLDINSSIDQTKLQCACSEGYYDSSQNNQQFKCSLKLKVNSKIDDCMIQLPINSNKISVNVQTNSYYNSQNMYESQINLNLTNTNISNQCLKQYQSQLSIYSQITYQYEIFPKQYLALDEFDQKFVSIPLESLQKIVGLQNSINQASIQFNFLLEILNNLNHTIRQHKWSSFYQMNSFESNYNLDYWQNSITQVGNSTSSDIIQGYICQDEFCIEERQNKKFNVGDVLFMKINLINGMILNVQNDSVHYKNDTQQNIFDKINSYDKNDTSQNKIESNNQNSKKVYPIIENNSNSILFNNDLIKRDQNQLLQNSVSKVISKVISNDKYLETKIYQKAKLESVQINDNINSHDLTSISSIKYMQDGSIIVQLPLQYFSQKIEVFVNLQLINDFKLSSNKLSNEILTKSFTVQTSYEPTEGRVNILSKSSLPFFYLVILLFFV